jgi:PH and SEC7 domain-containing protein
VNALGVYASPSSANHSFSSPTPPPKDRKTPRNQPSTPIVVPPTPSPAGPSSARLPESSPASPIHDLSPGAEDTDMQTKRRSLYRAPGTSSSPDLATLLRKAKERGGVIGMPHKKEKVVESPPPLPKTYGRTGGKMRQRPSTSTSNTSSQGPATPSKGLPTSRTNEVDCLRTDISSPSVSEWILANPLAQSKEDGTVKVRLLFVP